MGDQTFEGRTAAEAAIKACDALGVTRAALTYEVVSESGEGIDRKVVISVEVDREAAERAAQEPDDDRPARREARGGRERRGTRERGRGGRDRDRGGRGGRGRRSRREDDRGGRGGRGARGVRGGRGGRRRRADDDGDIENLLNLETTPPEPMEERPEIEGEVSERARVGRDVLAEVVELAGLDVVPRLVEDGDDEIHFDLSGEDAVRVIGNKGDALLALQFLTNRIIARKAEGDAHIVLDAASYRRRRREALAELARQLATRAVEEGKVVRLSPMSAHDRRIFHITLQEDDTVTTRSEGDGLYRPLLIIPASEE